MVMIQAGNGFTGSNAAGRLWAADAHQYGPGKVHVVDEADARKTFCGKWLGAVPGKPATGCKATCRSCLNVVESRRDHEAQSARWERVAEERRRLDEEERRAWWKWYDGYLKTPAWRERSSAAIKRAGGVCEGCGVRPAVHAHHVTYEHVGEEFLWELRAVCTACHDRAHAKVERKEVGRGCQ